MNGRSLPAVREGTKCVFHALHSGGAAVVVETGIQEVSLASRREKSYHGVGRKPGPGGKAFGTDEKIKAANLRRLQRIEGQIRGIQKMVEEDRYCADVLMQLSAVCKAMKAVGTEVLRNHLRHCATHAIKAGPKEAEAMYDELLDLMRKNDC